jgi:peptide/nickel transport system substrate-binding protein
MSRDAMRRIVFQRRRWGWRRAAALPLVLVTFVVAAVLTTTSAATATSHADRARSGGTVDFALPPGTSPKMILPFFSSAYAGTPIFDFMFLMYRPLYWFNGKAFQLTKTNSLAYPPDYNANDTAVTVKLKPWHWSNGEKLSPKDVAFFMGLLTAEKANWWGWIPGYFPTNVPSTTYDTAADSFTFHFKSPVNPTWFTLNQLSLVEPMPLAWDLSGAGMKANCSAETAKLVVTACAAAYKYLEHEASDTSAYGSNPLWQVVDGPFRLSSFSPGGLTVVLVPNKKYSGPDKAKIGALDLKSFTSEAAEYSVLKSGTSLTVGYLPFTDAPTKPNNAAIGHNPLPGYTLDPWPEWADNGMEVNWNNPNTGPVEHQLYFRQALQSLVDEQTLIRVAYRGYAFAEYGPVPPQPVTPYLTKYESSDPYPFSIDNARHDLTTHGWTIPTSGPATCTKPGTGPHDCGAGIPKGRKLTMGIIYPSGIESYQVELEDFQSDAREAGLEISLRSEPSNTIIASAPPCTPKQSSCGWQIVYFGTSSFAPLYFPDLGILFICHSVADESNYCNPTLDAVYTKVYSQKGLAALHDVEDFLTRQAVTISGPVPDAQLTEVSDKLDGYSQSGTGAITPQNWYFKS